MSSKNKIRYVYINFNNRCVLCGTAQEIAEGLEDWDENTPPDNDDDYSLFEVDKPETQIYFWDVFQCKVYPVE